MTAALLEQATRSVAAKRERLRALAVERFERSVDVPTRFVRDHAPLIARACLEMSGRLQRGGRLLAFGIGPAVTDARHVAVEFVHPVIVGKRALPAIALVSDEIVAGDPFERALGLLGRESDIAMAIAADGGQRLGAALHRAREVGMLTIAFVGEGGSPPADFVFHVPARDALIVQEVHELLYHLLWELVHVFLEHREAP